MFAVSNMATDILLLLAVINLVFVSAEEVKKELFKPAEEKLEKIGAAESNYHGEYLFDPEFVEHKHKYDKYHGPYSQTLKPIAALGDPHEYPDKLKVYKSVKQEKKHHYVPAHEIVTLKPIHVAEYDSHGHGHGVVYETPVNYGHEAPVHHKGAEAPGLYKDLYDELDNQKHKAEYNKDLHKLMDQQHLGIPYATGVSRGSYGKVVYQDSPVLIDKPVVYKYPVGYEHTKHQVPHHTEDHHYRDYYHHEKKEKKDGWKDIKKKLILKPIEWIVKAKDIFWKLH